MDNTRDEYKEAFVKKGAISVLGTHCHKERYVTAR